MPSAPSRHSSLRHRLTPARFRAQDERRTPSHRHAAPSAPWPWINIHDEVDAVQLSTGLPPVPPLCDHQTCGGCWRGYPQSRFPNWTRSQVQRSRIHKAIHEYDKANSCIIHHVDVDDTGRFIDSDHISVTTDQTLEKLWNRLVTSQWPPNIRVRALFIENLWGPVLQMLGTRYNIEPFFFSSSLCWIPSRFQEDMKEFEGDHITLTLTFLRVNDDIAGSTSSMSSGKSRAYVQTIDTQEPLRLENDDDGSCHLLLLDLLSVHLVRSTEGNTIISFHDPDRDATSAQYLHERIRFAGQSVYWQSIFQKSKDPTFVLLVFVWHAVYAWDEALEKLYNHICYLETRVINTSDSRESRKLTHQLHLIRAHLLFFSSLLEDFKKSVIFILETPNPAMDSLPDDERLFSRKLLEKECNNLLIEIERFEKARQMQDKRLKNVMNLVFSSVNIDDSRRMQELTEAAVRDSAAMKQIAYLSMIFLPASFVAGIFGMNVREIVPDTKGTIAHYVVTVVSFTVLTIWIVMAFQSKHFLHSHQHPSFWERIMWPYLLIKAYRSKPNKQNRDEQDVMRLNGWTM